MTAPIPAPPDDELPGLARPIRYTDRACCCPARPVVTVVIPAGRGHPHPADLLLCGHNYRVSLAALRVVGADVYDETGALIMTGKRATACAPRARRSSRIAAGFLLSLACQHRSSVSEMSLRSTGSFARHHAPGPSAPQPGRPSGDLWFRGSKVPTSREHRLWFPAARQAEPGGRRQDRMTRRQAVAVARAARAVRGLWPDRNPLRRTIDRIEAVIAGGLVVAFLAGAPLAAVAGGHAAYGSAARIAHAQQAAWHQVPAVLLATAPAARYRQDQVNAQARWTAPDGTGRTGTVLAPPGTRAGRVVMVWVDMAGRPTGDRPLQLSQARDEAELATILTPLALGLILLGAGFSVHVMLGRRRLAAWDADWQVTEPHWTTGR
jgi:hypothetical protein